MEIKNLAVVAHVDHGKTTLIDQLLKQSGALSSKEEGQDRIMDSQELEKERGITISAKNCAFQWKGVKLNLLDTPGHADFGQEVERSLTMVDGVLLLVDASEGPLPQTRFVMERALKLGLKVAVVINKVDRPDERIDEVVGEVEDLLLDILDHLGVDLDDADLDIPFFFASGKEGWARSERHGEAAGDMLTLLDFMISDYYPVACTMEMSQQCEKGDFQLRVANLSYSPYLGQLLVGRIHRGKVAKHDNLTLIGKDFEKNFKVTSLQVYHNLGTQEVNEAHRGEIVLMAGSEKVFIGDTVSSQEKKEALDRIEVSPPTVSVFISVSTSPFSGQVGEYLTARKLKDLLEEACLENVGLEYAATDDPKVYQLKGRGELQLGIVFETWRRRGFEFMLSRPSVLTKKDEEGRTIGPFERAVIDVPEAFTGTITEMMGKRKGVLEDIRRLNDYQSRLVFVIPSRGLIGFRSQFLTETKGEGIFSSEFLEYREYTGSELTRSNGAIICDRAGKMTPYALYNLLGLGDLFVTPGEKCYEGQVIGIHKKQNDINVNAVREKHLSSVRTAGKDENIILPPPVPMNIEKALDWIDQDEWVEITPEILRIRKKELEKNKRSVIRKV